MSGTFQKLGTILLWVLMAISVLLALIFYFDVAQLPSDASRELEKEVLDSSVNLYLGWAALLVAISAVAAVVFAIVGWIVQPEKAKRALVSILFLGGVVLISYFMADGTALDLPTYTGDGNTPGWNKFAGTGLIATYILLAIAVLATVSSGVIKKLR